MDGEGGSALGAEMGSMSWLDRYGVAGSWGSAN